MNTGTNDEATKVASLLESMGCPVEKCSAMAAQLEKRADQLTKERGGTREEATLYLIELMSQGWAANPNLPQF